MYSRVQIVVEELLIQEVHSKVIDTCHREFFLC